LIDPDTSTIAGKGPPPVGSVRIPYNWFAPKLKVTSSSTQGEGGRGVGDGVLPAQAVVTPNNVRIDRRAPFFMVDHLP